MFHVFNNISTGDLKISELLLKHKSDCHPAQNAMTGILLELRIEE